MASTYQLNGYAAYVREVDESLTEKFWQFLELNVFSALNSQVTYDIGNYVAGSLGTFWTAAIADTTPVTVYVAGVAQTTTQGALAQQALTLIQSIGALANINLIAVQGPYLLPLQQVVSGESTGQYALAVANNGPNITFGTAMAPTTSTLLVLTWDLPPGVHGVKSPVTYF